MVYFFMQPFGKQCIVYQLTVEGDDDSGCEPPENLNPERVHKLAHFGFVGSEAEKRPDCEAELHTEDDLAEDEKVSGLVFAVKTDDAYSGDNREPTCDQTPYCGWESEV